MTQSILFICSIALVGFADNPQEITIEQALALAKIHSPELRAADMYSQAAQKEVAAAGVWSNPTLTFEAEGVGGDNDLFSEGEYAIGLQQTFQRGGKRQQERNVALKAVDVRGYALMEKRVELVAAVRQAFLEVVYLEENGAVQTEQEELGRAFIEVAKRRYATGGGSELEVVQAELELEKILFAQTCCLGERMAAEEKLASLLGIPIHELPHPTASYYALEPLEIAVLNDAHPALQRLKAEVEITEAKAKGAKMQDISDISLGAGYKYEAGSDVNTFVFSASMPLSFNKRGRVEHAAGLIRATAVRAVRDEKRRQLQSELASEQALYMGAKAQAKMGKQKLIPKAKYAYELSRTGYEAGRFSWLELIASQQHLARIRIDYIEALKEAHLSQIKISKLKAEGM